MWDYLDVIVADVICSSLLKGDNFLWDKWSFERVEGGLREKYENHVLHDNINNEFKIWRPERWHHKNGCNAYAYVDSLRISITQSHVFKKPQYGTRLKHTKSLFGKIYNLNAGLSKELPTKAEVGLFSKFLLETVFLRWNICKNSFQFVRTIFMD